MRERIEDLGVISERLDSLMQDLENSVKHIESKHSLEQFFEFYKKEDNLEDLQIFLRQYKEQLWEVYCIARYGTDENI